VRNACTDEQWQRFGDDFTHGQGIVQSVSPLAQLGEGTWGKYFGESYRDDQNIMDEWQNNFLYGLFPLGAEATEYTVGVSCGSQNPADACATPGPGQSVS